MNTGKLLEAILTMNGRLELTGFELTDEDLATVAQVTGVRNLILTENPLVTIAGIKQLGPLGKGLESLDLWDFPLDDAGLQILTTLFPKLRRLHFGGKHVTVTETGLLAFAGFPNLQEVFIDRDDYQEELERLYRNLRVQIVEI